MFSALAAFGNAGGVLAPSTVGLVAERSNMHWGIGSLAILPLLLVAITAATASAEPSGS